MNSPRVLAIFSDIHAGSTQALMPPGLKLADDNEILMNPRQKWLWQCWLRTQGYMADFIGDDCYNLIFNGDLTEGVHHGGRQTISIDSGDHVDPASMLLAPLVATAKKNGGKAYVVAGTECHTGTMEAAIAKIIGAEINPESKRHIWDVLQFDICGLRARAQHHFPATGRSYLESGQYSIQMGNEIIEAHRNSEVISRILIGAHRHRGGHFTDGKSLVVVTPPWQCITRHGFKVVPSARPRPGMVILDWRQREDGELPDVHLKDYETPSPCIVSMSQQAFAPTPVLAKNRSGRNKVSRKNRRGVA
jgi:hypothetical protein